MTAIDASLTPISPLVSPASYLQAARIVTAVPRQLTAAEYFARICPQVRQLLTVRGIDACHFASCAVSVVNLMLQQHREHVMKYLLLEIMRPFTEFMQQFEQDTSHVTPTRGLISLNSVNTTSLTRVIVSEAELAQSVTELHELLTRHVTPVMCEIVTPSQSKLGTCSLKHSNGYFSPPRALCTVRRTTSRVKGRSPRRSAADTCQRDADHVGQCRGVQ